ncbi:MAG: Rab family GTPase [Candidatus Thorarchaeota archaeon]
MTHYLLKVLTVGAASVGKTSTIIRYSTGAFREHYSPTLGVGFAYKKLKVDDNLVNLQIWDLGAQDFLELARANYYMGGQGVIFMYDVTNQESLTEVYKWKSEVDRNLDDYQAVLVGNKTDLVMERVISTEEGQKIAKEFDIDYIEISVRLNNNINDLFGLVARRVIESFP